MQNGDTFAFHEFNDNIFGCSTTNFTKYNVKCTIERFFASLNEQQNILAETMYTTKYLTYQVVTIFLTLIFHKVM